MSYLRLKNCIEFFFWNVKIRITFKTLATYCPGNIFFFNLESYLFIAPLNSSLQKNFQIVCSLSLLRGFSIRKRCCSYGDSGVGTRSWGLHLYLHPGSCRQFRTRGTPRPTQPPKDSFSCVMTSGGGWTVSGKREKGVYCLPFDLNLCQAA